MKALLRFRHVVVGLLFVAALGATSVAAGNRPFKAKGTAQILGDPFAVSPFNASGTATHLGAWTGGGLVVYGFTEEGDLGVFGYLVMVAANGNELYSWFYAIQNPDSGLLEGFHYFEGGTGRFASATGEVSVIGQPLPGNQVKLDMNGTINY